MLALQGLLVALIVIGSTVYAACALMPAAARRWLATRALRLPLPARLAAPLRRAAQAANACGCEGCDHAAAKPAVGATQRVTFHPRPRR